MTWEIRMAKVGEHAALQEIATAAYTPYIAIMDQVPAPMVADFVSNIANDIVFVGEGDGQIWGYAIVLRHESGFWLDNIAVTPSRHGCGVGGALIAAVEAWISDRADIYQLYTNVMMTRNLDLYRHLGFVETGRRVVDGYDRVYFKKRF